MASDNTTLDSNKRNVLLATDTNSERRLVRTTPTGELLVATGTTGIVPDPLHVYSPMVTPISGNITGPVTDSILLAVPGGSAIEYLKFHLHMDPAATGSYNTATLRIGSLVIFTDKFEAGLPYLESIVLLTPTLGDDITITLTDANTIYYNLRYMYA